MRGEFQLIAELFAPLATSPGAYGLRNDAACLEVPEGEALVVTLDTLIEGVHYLPDDPPGQVAQKLLRVNLSDLAAMGARPLGYLLSTALGPSADDAWLTGFAAGLAADQERFGVSLLGGDTVKAANATTLSLTALGTLPKGQGLPRSGGRPGDLVYLSGTLGDAALGLKVLQGGLPDLAPEARAFLAERYRLPRPRVDLGPALLGLASACIDVSDGLLADLGHIAEESGCGAEIAVPDLPLSAAAAAIVADDAAALETVLGGGDDYELLFTVPPVEARRVAALAEEIDLPLTRIGRLVEGEGVRALDHAGGAMKIARSGWVHF